MVRSRRPSVAMTRYLRGERLLMRLLQIPYKAYRAGHICAYTFAMMTVVGWILLSISAADMKNDLFVSYFVMLVSSALGTWIFGAYCAFNDPTLRKYRSEWLGIVVVFGPYGAIVFFALRGRVRPDRKYR